MPRHGDRDETILSVREAEQQLSVAMYNALSRGEQKALQARWKQLAHRYAPINRFAASAAEQHKPLSPRQGQILTELERDDLRARRARRPGAGTSVPPVAPAESWRVDVSSEPVVQCRAIKSNGERCANAPQRGEQFCGPHLDHPESRKGLA
jgi:hypothetical protein